MAAKIIVGAQPTSDDKAAKLKQRVADALGVLADDVAIIPGVQFVAICEAPADLVKARQAKDKADGAEKEKAEKEAAKAADKPAAGPHGHSAAEVRSRSHFTRGE